MGFFTSYLLAEILYSSLRIGDIIRSPREKIIWFHEEINSVGNFNFDPNIGYRVSTVPARLGVVTPEGELLSMGVSKGNNLGFPDNRDFNIENEEDDLVRIAVLGDSFSASQFTEKSWVEVAEQKINNEFKNKTVILMNFSLEGIGLGNWASIVKNNILAKNIKINGIIFAVAEDDVDRKFMWKDDSFFDSETGRRQLHINYVNSWDPEKYQKEFRKEKKSAEPLEGWEVLSSEEIDKIETGKWKHTFSRDLKPYLMYELFYQLTFFINNFVDFNEQNSNNFEKKQLKIIEDLRDNCNKLDVPLLVIKMGSYLDKKREFADLINASYIDDKKFQKTIKNETDFIIRHDGHWNQKGSNLFASAIYFDILDWLKEEKIIFK